MEYPDVKKMMEATMAMSIAAQIFLRFLLYMIFPESYAKMNEGLKEFYLKLDTSNEQRQRLLFTHISRLKSIIKFLFVIHAFCQFGPITWSFMTFFIRGHYLYPLPIYLPFINRYSTFGFIVNCCFQIYLNLALYFGNPAADSTYFMLIMQLKIEVDIFQCTLEDFSEILSLNDDSAAKEKIDKMLVKVVDDHLSIVQFHQIVKSIINKQFFVLIAMNVYVICASGVSLITSEFTVTIGIAILYPVQIFISCALGTFICHQQDRLEAVLWEFDWYKLNTANKKKFLFSMLNVQQGLRLQPMFLGVINMELFTTVSLTMFISIFK